jgi:predicted RNA-binding protein
MCEFTVFLNDEKVFDDAIYAVAVNGNVSVRNILGEQKNIANCEINEINVLAEKLVLRVTSAQ